MVDMTTVACGSDTEIDARLAELLATQIAELNAAGGELDVDELRTYATGIYGRMIETAILNTLSVLTAAHDNHMVVAETPERLTGALVAWMALGNFTAVPMALAQKAAIIYANEVLVDENSPEAMMVQFSNFLDELHDILHDAKSGISGENTESTSNAESREPAGVSN